MALFPAAALTLNLFPVRRGCYFPTFPACIVIQHYIFGFVLKALLTTIHDVVLLLQETEPLFLWKMLFPINIFLSTIIQHILNSDLPSA